MVDIEGYPADVSYPGVLRSRGVEEMQKDLIYGEGLWEKLKRGLFGDDAAFVP